jgi:UDP-N-acetylglucosamine/UDP-N-acetylgalactosamine diphosphorylase
VVQNNILYIANLLALKQWYVHVRSEFVSDDFPEGMKTGLIEKVDMAISERLKRLGGLTEKLAASAEKYRAQMKEKASERLLLQKSELNEKWPQLRQIISAGAGESGQGARDGFLSAVQGGIRTSGKDYLAVIRGLDDRARDGGTRWLQEYVDAVTRNAFSLLPSYGFLES